MAFARYISFHKVSCVSQYFGYKRNHSTVKLEVSFGHQGEK
jgi:hypothetical protein